MSVLPLFINARRSLLLVLTCISISTTLVAQSQAVKYNSEMVVMDSSGTVYPYFVWYTLIRSGDYILLPVDKNKKHSPCVLVKLSSQEKEQRLATMAKPAESAYFKTGKKVGFFKTTDINGAKIQLKELQGKIVVINFWFINCPPCRMEIPALNEIVDHYRGNDSVVFLGIALDTKNDIELFMKTVPFKYDIIDSGRSLADRFGVRAFPTHLIIDQQGAVYFHTAGLGLNTVYWIRKSIDDLLQQSVVAR